MDRTFVFAEIIPCPNGWDADNCHDSGRGLNPCGSDSQHCLGNGTALEIVNHMDDILQGHSHLDDSLDACACGPDEWKYRLHVGDVQTSGVSVWACEKCYLPRAAAIIAEWGTCTTSPR